jgi:hypothetical protein
VQCQADSEGATLGGCFVLSWLQLGLGVGPGHATALWVFLLLILSMSGSVYNSRCLPAVENEDVSATEPVGCTAVVHLQHAVLMTAPFQARRVDGPE